VTPREKVNELELGAVDGIAHKEEDNSIIPKDCVGIMVSEKFYASEKGFRLRTFRDLS